MANSRQKAFEYVEPIGARVVVRKDDPKRETKGGIALPDDSEIPTITGRIVAISAQIEHDEDLPLRQYDKILFHPKGAIPVDFEPDNQLGVVPVEDVVATRIREQGEDGLRRRRDHPFDGHDVRIGFAHGRIVGSAGATRGAHRRAGGVEPAHPVDARPR